MILDALGNDSGPLLVAGLLGGMVRGLIVFRGVAAKGPVTRPILIATAFDTGTSMIIGACFSLFFHEGGAILLKPILDLTTADAGARLLESGFVTGFLCLAIAGFLLDFASKIGKP